MSWARATCGPRSGRCKNLELALGAAGATLGDLVKSTTYVTDYELYVRNADLRDEIFKDRTDAAACAFPAGYSSSGERSHFS